MGTTSTWRSVDFLALTSETVTHFQLVEPRVEPLGATGYRPHPTTTSSAAYTYCRDSAHNFSEISRLNSQVFPKRTRCDGGHCRVGSHDQPQPATGTTGLGWTGNQPTAKRRWCPYRAQTREHVVRNYLHWKAHQKRAQCETLERELRERSEREEEEWRQEAEELGAEVEGQPLFLPHPPSWPLRKRSREPGATSFVFPL